MGIKQWIVAVLVGIGLFAIAAVVAMTVFLKTSDLKKPVEQAVTQATGQPFEVQGELDVEWFPSFRLQTGAAQLGDPPAVQWKSARVGAKLAPLLGGSVVLDRIDIEGLTARFGDHDENVVNLPRVQLDVSPWKPGGTVNLRAAIRGAPGGATHLRGVVHPPKDGAPQIWRFELHGDRIDLAQYLTLGKSEDEEPFELPVDALKNLPVAGVLTFDEFEFGPAQVKDLRLELAADQPRRNARTIAHASK